MRRFYDCEDCIGMKAHGRYCQAMGADAPGGVLHPTRDEEADALARDAIARRDREAGRRTTRAIVVSAVILVMVYAGLIWLVAP